MSCGEEGGPKSSTLALTHINPGPTLHSYIVPRHERSKAPRELGVHLIDSLVEGCLVLRLLQGLLLRLLQELLLLWRWLLLELRACPHRLRQSSPVIGFRSKDETTQEATLPKNSNEALQQTTKTGNGRLFL